MGAVSRIFVASVLGCDGRGEPPDAAEA